MRIAQVAPLFESVPPAGYGGTERIVSYLTEELVRMGHEVTLYASGDSITRAALKCVCPHALRTDPRVEDKLIHHFIMLEELYRDAEQYDFIHFHVDYLSYPFARRGLAAPYASTLHGRLDINDLPNLYKEYKEIPLISISNSQRKPLQWLNWQATVYHGLPLDLHRFQESAKGYLVFLGRLSPEKRCDRAIEISWKAGMKLKIAAKVDAQDQEYYKNTLLPQLQRAPNAEFIGEVDEKGKDELLGGAEALLFPIDWEEPFGLVMIEALACGTPVIAYPQGAVPEVIEHGVTGFLVNNIEESLKAVEQIKTIDRRTCRRVFEERFSAPRMAENYTRVYERMIDRHRFAEPVSRIHSL